MLGILKAAAVSNNLVVTLAKSFSFIKFIQASDIFIARCKWKLLILLILSL